MDPYGFHPVHSESSLTHTDRDRLLPPVHRRFFSEPSQDLFQNFVQTEEINPSTDLLLDPFTSGGGQ